MGKKRKHRDSEDYKRLIKKLARKLHKRRRRHSPLSSSESSIQKSDKLILINNIVLIVEAWP